MRKANEEGKCGWGGEMDKRTGAVILAGGKGKRMHSAVQKQYLSLDGKPLIFYSLDAFEKSQVDEIVLVVGAGEEDKIRCEIVEHFGFTKVSKVVAGGKERYHSVYAGLQALEGCEYVLIHDGARPLVTDEIISRSVRGAREYQACVAGMPVKDTMKTVDESGFSDETLERARIWQIQTPQAFYYPLVRTAYDWIMEREERQTGITDDAMAVERYGGCKVKLVEGSYENLKVTTPEDMAVAEALLRERKKEKKK